MLMIRFQRIGRTNDPAFRIAVMEKERAAKTGNIVELLGTYNPRSKALTLDQEAVKAWIAKGAQPTDSIHNLLVAKGVIEGKKINVLPKKTLLKKESDAAPAAAAPAAPVSEAPAPVEAEVPAEPTEAEVAAEALPAQAGEPAPEVAPEASAPAEVAPETPATESAPETPA